MNLLERRYKCATCGNAIITPPDRVVFRNNTVQHMDCDAHMALVGTRMEAVSRQLVDSLRGLEPEEELHWIKCLQLVLSTRARQLTGQPERAA